MDLPVNVSTGMVVGRYIADVIDGPDANLDPDAQSVQGRIVFTASVPYLPNPTAGPDPVTIMRVPIVGVLDQDGYLCTPYPGTLEPQYRGVRLIATDDPDISVTDWTWDVTYIFEPVNGHKLAIPAHGFSLPSGETVDLTKVAKVPSSPGYSLPQAEAAVLRAEAIAQSIRDDADNGVFNGEAATLEIGDVVSGPSAGVVNVGDEQHAILNITLEKGDKGDIGEGIPAGGEPLQVVRKTPDGATTEWADIDKNLVGLSNVDNTADADKPVSGPTEIALADKADADAVTAIEPEGGNRAVGKGELLVNVRDYGVAGTGLVDDSAGLQAAADAARAAKATLWVPNDLRLRVDNAVNLRFIDVKFDGFLTVGAGALPYGVLVGDSSNVRVGRKISFKSALHIDNSTQTSPCIRVQGLMGGHVEIGRCDYIQIYANETEEPGQGDACAYATYNFTGGSVRHLELLGEAGQSWINENLFLGGDYRKITIRGTYTHNSNTFMKPSIEGANSLVDIQRGARNKFLNARGEYNPKIKFGAQTWQNILTDGFTSNAQARTPGFIVEEDLGMENVVAASIDEFLEPRTLFRLDSNANMFDTAAAHPGLPVRPGLRKLLVNANFQTVVRTVPVPVVAGKSRLRRIEFSSDAVLWRPRIRLYDTTGAQLNPTGLTDATGGWSIGGTTPDQYMQFSAAKDSWTVLLTSPLVAFMSVEIQSSGSTAGEAFTRLTATAYRHGSDSDALIDQWRRAFTAPLFGASPTQGRALPGAMVAGASANHYCVAASASVVSSAASLGATALSVASTTGMTSGDNVGVLLADGTTHWSKIASVGSSTNVTLTVALTGSVIVGAEVVTSRWVTR